MLRNLLFIGLGCVIASIGTSEYVLSRGSAKEPVPTELALLESGAAPPNGHLEIGPHWKLWDELIYSYSSNHGQTEDLDTLVDYAYYPILSETHPYFAKVAALGKRNGSADKAPEVDLPALDTFAVLVRTRAFQRIGDIPQSRWENAQSLRGLVVNETRTLNADEQELLRRSFPSVDIAKIVILEEGRRPSSTAYALSLLVAGGALSLLGVGLFFAPGRTSDRSSNRPKDVSPRDLEETSGAALPRPVSNPLTKVHRGLQTREGAHPD